MVDASFYKSLGPYKLSTIIAFLQDTIEVPIGNYENITIHNIKTIEEASSSDVTFLSNPKYASFL